MSETQWPINEFGLHAPLDNDEWVKEIKLSGISSPKSSPFVDITNSSPYLSKVEAKYYTTTALESADEASYHWQNYVKEMKVKLLEGGK